MFKVLVTGRNFGSVSKKDFDYFLNRGYKVVDNPYCGRAPTVDELCGIIGGVDALLAGAETINEKVFAAAESLKVVSRFGVGYDSVDLAAASARGVAVTNVPGTTADSVADLTMGLMLCVSKLIIYTNRRVMNGMWPADRGHDIAGKTLGIVGFGRIGRGVAKRAAGFAMRILAYDPQYGGEAGQALGVERATLDEIVETADYITLHIPKTPETTNLFDAARIGRMKRGSYLVNAARGGIVDEDALYDALQSGHLAGAALDVLAVEPPKARPRLFDCENCLITSHSGGNSQESILMTAKAAADNIIAVLEGKPCANVVNARELGW